MITDIVLFFNPLFSPHNNQQHNDGNNDNTLHHIATRTNTHSTDTSHHTTPSTFFFPAQIETHFIRSGTRLAQDYLDKLFLA